MNSNDYTQRYGPVDAIVASVSVPRTFIAEVLSHLVMQGNSAAGEHCALGGVAQQDYGRGYEQALKDVAESLGLKATTGFSA